MKKFIRFKPLGLTLVTSLLTTVQPTLAAGPSAGLTAQTVAKEMTPNAGGKVSVENKLSNGRGNKVTGSMDIKTTKALAQELKRQQGSSDNSDNETLGGIHGGGGNAIDGRLVASYMTELQDIPGYKNYLVYENSLKAKLPVMHKQSLVVARKFLTFFLVPDSEFKQLSIKRTGIPAESDQVALQLGIEVWINKTEFMKMKSDEERGRFLLHELTEFLVLRAIDPKSKDIQTPMQLQRKLLGFIIKSAAMTESEASEAFVDILKNFCNPVSVHSPKAYSVNEICKGIRFDFSTATEVRSQRAPTLAFFVKNLPIIKQTSERLYRANQMFCQENEDLINKDTWTKDDTQVLATKIEKFEKGRYGDLYHSGLLSSYLYPNPSNDNGSPAINLSETTVDWIKSFADVGLFDLEIPKTLYVKGFSYIFKGDIETEKNTISMKQSADPATLKCTPFYNEYHTRNKQQVQCETQFLPSLPAGWSPAKNQGAYNFKAEAKIYITPERLQNACAVMSSGKRAYDKEIKELEDYINEK